MINEENILGDFKWEEISTEADFFNTPDGEQLDKTDVKTVIEEISKDEEGDGKKPETDVEDEEDLFKSENLGSPTDNKGEEEEEEEEDSVESPNVLVLNKLKEKGLIDFNLEENEELTEELAEELLEEKFEESVDNKVKELMGDLSDDKKQFIQFLLKGGNPVEFFNAVYNGSESINVNSTLETEDEQISVMKKLLKLEEKDDEEIEAEIEFMKNSGKLKSLTEKKLGKYKKEIEDSEKEFLEEQEKARENEKNLIKQAKTKVTAFLSENEEVNGIKFSKEDKKVLPSYMNDKSVKLQNGAFITQMQKELFYDLPKNQEALIQLATLLRNRNEDGSFNFDSIAVNTRTKVTQEVKKNIRRDNKTSIPGNSTIKSKESGKSLSDYFI